MDGNNFQLVAMIVTSSMNSNAPQNLNLEVTFLLDGFWSPKKKKNIQKDHFM